MKHFFSSFLYLSSLTLPEKIHHPNRTLFSPLRAALSLSLFLLLFVVLSARRRTHNHTRTHTLAVTLSRNCQKFPISRDLFGSLSLALPAPVVRCLLIFLPVCSHKSVAAGALQRNFLPFIAQHIFFGIFFLFAFMLIDAF